MALRRSMYVGLKSFYKSHRIQLEDAALEFPLFNDHVYGWFVRYAYRSYNWHEPSITKLLLDLDESKKIFLDIGAHLGYFSCIFSRREGATSLAIELDPTNFDDLEKMVRLTKGVHGRIECLNMGISDRSFFAEMPVQNASAMSSLDEVTDRGGNTRSVPVTTLDSFCRERDLRPDVIKVDIEGYEWEFVCGAKEILRNFNPILIIEVHSNKLKDKNLSEEMLVKSLLEYDYDIFWFEKHRSRRPYKLVPFNGAGGLDNYDIVCKPKSFI